MLKEDVKRLSVEPNDVMREIGIERTKGEKIEWIRATGLNSTLQNSEFDLVTFCSSFNIMDKNEALEGKHIAY